MIERLVTFQKPGRHAPDPARDGDRVEYSTPAGSQLLRSFDLVEWVAVPEASPFVHQGGAAHYMLASTSGARVAASIRIGAPV